MAIDDLSIVGGKLCLDFVNTAGDHLTDQPREWLENYRDFALWAVRVGAITDAHAAHLLQHAEKHADAADQVLSKALMLRETLYRLLLSVIRKQTPDSADLATFNQALAETPARTTIIYTDEQYLWQAPRDDAALDAVLWRVLWSAADLLTSDQLAQVKLCSGDDCGWMFLDTSRNQSRRWCSMADCGNRAKANRYYRLHKTD